MGLNNKVTICLIILKKIKCNCKRKKDIDIEEVFVCEFIDVLKNNTEIKNIDVDFYSDKYIISYKNTTIKINLHYGNIAFYRKACLSCETCLGWVAKNLFYSLEIKSPESYVDKFIQKTYLTELKKNKRIKFVNKICK